METVEVLIRIPKEEYEELQSNYAWWGKYGEYIKNGTILQKGHGRLIDENTIVYTDEEFEDGRTYMIAHPYDIENAPTIIEADKAESERVNCENTKCENCTNHNYCDYEL